MIKKKKKSDDLSLTLILVTFGVIFIVVSIYITFFVASRTVLTCEREVDQNNGNCNLSHTTILSKKDTPIPLESINKASVERKMFKRSENFCIILETETGKIEFAPYFASGSEDKEENSKQINNFLMDKSRTSLLIEQDNFTDQCIYGLAFFILGLFMESLGIYRIVKKRNSKKAV